MTEPGQAEPAPRPSFIKQTFVYIYAIAATFFAAGIAFIYLSRSLSPSFAQWQPFLGDFGLCSDYRRFGINHG
jgi:hypothetical protein